MAKKLSKLRKFSVKGLFGRNLNFEIPFENDIKILIGENGLGKTTILNMLYHTLTQNFHKLRDYQFEEIVLEFIGRKKVSIDRRRIIELSEEIEYYEDPSARRIRNYFTHNILDTDILRNAVKSKGISNIELYEYIIDRTEDKYLRRISPNRLVRAIRNFIEAEEKNEVVGLKRTIAKSLDNAKILYFPTYRRIEEDLRNLGFEEDTAKISRKDQRLIQFGMKDVRERFEGLKSEIESLSSKGLSKISSEILSQLIKGRPKINNQIIESISPEDIEIILSRAGDALSNEDKNTIIDITQRKRIANADPMLIYFLQKLIEVYDQQREIDEEIKKFVSVCNKYLERSGKEIIYDESEVDFYMGIGRELFPLKDLLSKLSSGEKQIISLFSKIYLSKANKFYVLFDEPELSLSIFWQRMLLPDIIDSGKCSFLLSVTHSPFVFENYLDEHAVGLNEYFIR